MQSVERYLQLYGFIAGDHAGIRQSGSFRQLVAVSRARCLPQGRMIVTAAMNDDLTSLVATMMVSVLLMQTELGSEPNY